MIPELKQGDLRIWNPGIPEIVDWPVKVCGQTSVGVPILGISYIVELLKPLSSYPYTHVVAFGKNLH